MTPDIITNTLELALRAKAEKEFGERLQKAFLAIRRELKSDTLYAKTHYHEEGKTTNLSVEQVLRDLEKVIRLAQNKYEGDRAIRQFFVDFESMREKMNELGIDLPEVE